MWVTQPLVFVAKTDTKHKNDSDESLRRVRIDQNPLSEISLHCSAGSILPCLASNECSCEKSAGNNDLLLK